METKDRFLNCPTQSFFLFGPRGTGKSTWLKTRMPDALLVDLLEPAVSYQLRARPAFLRELLDGDPRVRTVVIDEIQRVPTLLTVVHQLMEEKRGVRFVMTGSSSRKLKREGVDLLAGRALLVNCHPFLATELGTDFSLDQALTVGMLPVALASDDPAAVLKAYLALYMREEVQMEGLVRNLDGFARFLEAVSFSHASLLSISDVSRECAVSRTTVEGYVSILEDLLVAARLPVFGKRAKRQLVGHDKFYLFDAGVYRALRPKGPLDRPEEIDGAALEGLVFQHLRGWNDYSGAPNALSFWRTQGGLEVDFVVYGEAGMAAVEVKNSTKVSAGDLRGMKAFAADYPEARRFLLYRGRERFLRDGVLCVPCEEFLKNLRPGQPIAEP
ncbi:MAG: AAA family ATPase [Acidobacteriota bacterium]|jgi:predicted AAA+ superfamily ATPase|nr:AAA family ATPase [Acidobacteriota bacterium]